MFGFEEWHKLGLGGLLCKYGSEKDETSPSGPEDSFPCNIYLITAQLIEGMGSRAQSPAGRRLGMTDEVVLVHGRSERKVQLAHRVRESWGTIQGYEEGPSGEKI
jgi:hypothetical protein